MECGDDFQQRTQPRKQWLLIFAAVLSQQKVKLIFGHVAATSVFHVVSFRLFTSPKTAANHNSNSDTSHASKQSPAFVLMDKTR